MRLLVLLLLPFSAEAATQQWHFKVYLDAREIGYHRFTLTRNGAERELVSEARFEVTLLGFRAYRYRHDALERWRGDCLQSLASRTDDNGERLSVEWRASGACEMSFAYWNPRILDAPRLLNAQTGELKPVQVTRLGEGRWRLDAEALAPIELAYAGGDWVGLETTARGRRLTYRIEK